MLSPADLATYRRDGFIVLPDILKLDEVEALRGVTEEFVRNARSVAANDEIYDLEDTHSAAEPRVRRIKTPHKHFPFFAELTRNPRITAILAQLIGENIRLDPINLHHLYSSDELLSFFMGKNTQERQEFIIENLRVEKDLIEV